jgi:hypothetical protein
MWMRLHKEELHDLYFSPNVKQIKKNEIGAIFVALWGTGEMHTWLGNLRERDHLEDLGLDGRVILK